ncbi:Ankyrin repeat domain-containing protein 50 [Trichoderma lentiforme]|uniref:Ankyrin repeat domain-containing protein 50 n=1 Tax=Trichoderma lentiforme TaxID=1567552 RepID=A0A9P4XC93_9HYPO|nr:Ankyrin repeat domain-containing protein 50 [Trichoderma lentiforme]
MQALYTSPYLQRKNRNPDRVIGTCEWFMDHHDFHNWRNNTASSMLWVSANPGCGKSVLAKYLVDELKSTEQRTTCYFFFKDDFEDQRSAKGALSCILHQLFFQRERLFSAEIVKRFKSYKAPPANSYYELWELWDILTMATQEKNAGEIICILDAFDECVDQERQDLAKVLREFYGPNGDSKKSVNLKFLITSRPYDTIRRNLIRPFDSRACPIIHLKGDGDAEVEKISGEINLYIKDRVSLIRADFGLTRKEEEILLQGLGAIHNQTYLWVYLTLEWIETEISNKISEAEIRNAISTLPRTVDEAYDKILAKSTDMKKTKTLLHIVVAAERPLTLAEMDLALAIRRRHKTYEELALRPSDRVRKYIRDLCGLFISITDDKIYLLHQTAKEFLVPKDSLDNPEYSLVRREGFFREDDRNDFTWKFSLIPYVSHRILCKICIWHLLFTKFETRPSADPLADYLCDNLFLEYSAKNWATHFRKSNIAEHAILRKLQQLCSVTSDRCPAWFEMHWADIHTDLPLHFTTLMIASYFGLEMIVSLQIESDNVEIDSVDGSYHRTALSFASENGFDSVVRLLIKGPKFYGKKALKKAVRLSYTKGADVNAIDKYNRTALFYAAWNGHVSIVKRLLKAGARVDMMDTIGGTPISYALCYGQEDIATELMRGAQPDSVDEIRRKLLLSAVKHDHDPVIKRLLDSGADPGATDDEGVSLVVWAINQGKTNILKLLIEKGADANKGDFDGTTPLTSAVCHRLTNVIKFLIEKGADVNKGDYDGKTALVLAIIHRATDVIKLLIKKGADVNKGDYKGFTPLILAITQKLMNVIKILIEKGADVNKGNHKGDTPLMFAAGHGLTDVIELLIEKGADVNMGDRDGEPALVSAMRYHDHARRSDMVEMLLKGGSRVDYTFTVSNIHTYALQLIVFDS